ncbi:hypothetical protein L9G74_19350 [Shewanella sp. C32]|uniref:DUF3299 domain-containing protein n=1 Tax=Shewanella electrica TaxID=515560 RepID=A0ABT2FQH7_9GAMM|nr:hypothetical protein [Shewanella electrica]MCH1926977.1 hypothetical protein [Shewanella electrica]MCS4558598.1 hypothetical protein [Shewanella electrica]
MTRIGLLTPSKHVVIRAAMFTLMASGLAACSSVTSVAPTASVAEPFQLTANIDSFAAAHTSEQLELALANDVNIANVSVDASVVYQGYLPKPFVFSCDCCPDGPPVTTYQFIETGIRFVPLTGETERLGYWQVISMNAADVPLE